MNAIVLTMLCVLAALQPNDWTPVVATEGAVVTLEKTAPAPTPPKPQPDPDGAGAAGQPVMGPLDTLHDAKELIRKGNELADRSKAILDQAERDGKVTVDIRLPGPAPAQVQNRSCPSGTCPLVPPLPVQTPPDVAPLPATQGCPGGVCRLGLLGRRRR